MVKGISRQVILMRPQDRGMFEQAIFILREDSPGEGVTEDALMKEARRILREPAPRQRLWLRRALWALAGAGVTGALWLSAALI